MNTIKAGENLTINLPQMKNNQVITVHNFANSETYIFKSEIPEIEQKKLKVNIFNVWVDEKPEAVNPATAEPVQKRWKPKKGERYGYIDDCGDWIVINWAGDYADEYRYLTGNCYPITSENNENMERAIWEQVTRKKYEQALWDAADWVEGDYYFAVWNVKEKRVDHAYLYNGFTLDKPRFATKQSAIDAHTSILGDDAERYFKGRG